MPNNQDNGALEEFYLKLATNIDVDFIDKIIQQAEEKKGITSFKPQHRNKAMMLIFLIPSIKKTTLLGF
jgi:translation elongation factor EF-4